MLYIVVDGKIVGSIVEPQDEELDDPEEDSCPICDGGPHSERCPYGEPF